MRREIARYFESDMLSGKPLEPFESEAKERLCFMVDCSDTVHFVSVTRKPKVILESLRKTAKSDMKLVAVFNIPTEASAARLKRYFTMDKRCLTRLERHHFEILVYAFFRRHYLGETNLIYDRLFLSPTRVYKKKDPLAQQADGQSVDKGGEHHFLTWSSVMRRPRVKSVDKKSAQKMDENLKPMDLF